MCITNLRDIKLDVGNEPGLNSSLIGKRIYSCNVTKRARTKVESDRAPNGE